MAKQRSAHPSVGKRWTEDDARRFLESWRTSGQSVADFARSAGIDRQRLLWWRRRLGLPVQDEKRHAAAVAATLVPVVVRGAPMQPTTSAVTVTSVRGTRVEVMDVNAATAAWVRSLLDGEVGA